MLEARLIECLILLHQRMDIVKVSRDEVSHDVVLVFVYLVAIVVFVLYNQLL